MKRKRVFLLLPVLICFLPIFLQGQSNVIIDELLEEEAADFARTTYLVLAAAELIGEEAAPEEALLALAELGWRIEVKEAGEPIKLGEYSFMLMKAFNMQGGLMYRILPGPRYASRELKFLKFISGNQSPHRTLSGEEVLRILGRLLEWKGEEL